RIKSKVRQDLLVLNVSKALLKKRNLRICRHGGKIFLTGSKR
ncbi:aerobic respiration control sensor protein ArcB, partial [Vibrio parahaemolyticus EKP-028]